MMIEKDRLFWHMPYSSMFENLDKIKLHQLNCEIYISSVCVLDSYTNQEVEQINLFFSINKLQKTLHGPFRELNPVSMNDPVLAKLSRQRFIQSIELARKLKTKSMVVHSHYTPAIDAKQSWLERSIEFWKEMVELARRNDVTLFIENGEDETPEMIIEIIESVNSKNLKACIDTGHFNVHSDKSIIECISMYPDDFIGEFHFSDNKGYSDEHLVLGKGSIDYDAIFKAIEKRRIKPIITIEQSHISDVPEMIKYLKLKSLCKNDKKS